MATDMATGTSTGRTRMSTEHGHDLRHHGDAEVRDDGGSLVDLAVNVRADTPPVWLREHKPPR